MIYRQSMLLALIVSLALVLAAPFIGELRRWVQATMPGQYVWIVNGVVGLSVAALAVAALMRLRAGRVWRFALLGVAALVAVVFARLTGSANPAVAAVGHFSFVPYRVITWPFYRAWRGKGDPTSPVGPAPAAFVRSSPNPSGSGTASGKPEGGGPEWTFP